jgi:hypothetical protein
VPFSYKPNRLRKLSKLGMVEQGRSQGKRPLGRWAEDEEDNIEMDF